MGISYLYGLLLIPFVAAVVFCKAAAYGGNQVPLF
jgi:hypothetical protein